MKEEYIKELLDKNKNDYNLIAEEFSRTRWFVWDETKFLFDNYLKEKDKVLDLGCGNGRYYGVVKYNNADYIGIDNSEKLLEEARKKYPEARFQLADALSIPFADKSFDKVYSMAVFHHIPSKKIRLEFLKEAKRVLKDDGIFVLTVWKFYRPKEYFLLFKYTILKLLGKTKVDFKDFFEPWGDETERYYHWFSKRELSKLFKTAGFKVKDIGVVRNKKGNRRNIYIVAAPVV